MGVLGAVLVVLGLLVAGGAFFIQGEVARACASRDAQIGTLIGHPDAQACQSYPPMLNTALLAGLGVAALGVALLVLKRG